MKGATEHGKRRATGNQRTPLFQSLLARSKHTSVQKNKVAEKDAEILENGFRWEGSVL